MKTRSVEINRARTDQAAGVFNIFNLLSHPCEVMDQNAKLNSDRVICV